MSVIDLYAQPICRPEDLGRPIPASPHAVSMALPRWQDVVGYEEKWPDVMSRLTSGYPRFLVHPLVEALARKLAGDRPCLPFPSVRVAQWAADFVRQSSAQPAEVRIQEGDVGVITNEAGYADLKAFWQHTGLIVSSREAQARLAGATAIPQREALAVRQALRRQLAGFYGCAADDVFLLPTGMAAQFAALRAVQRRAPGLPTGQLGFPYVDTLKLQRKFGRDGILLHALESIEEDLHALVHRQPLAACFCEIPGNPLLGSADVRQIRPLLREHGVLK